MEFEEFVLRFQEISDDNGWGPREQAASLLAIIHSIHTSGRIIGDLEQVLDVAEALRPCC